jgi:hypothetical protein
MVGDCARTAGITTAINVNDNDSDRDAKCLMNRYTSIIGPFDQPDARFSEGFELYCFGFAPSPVV